jgi:GNAT superfamily N-acetyltransferase
MIEKLLALVQEHVTLNEAEQLQWKQRIESEDRFIPIRHHETIVGGLSYEFWTYHEDILSCSILCACETGEEALLKSREAIQTFIKNHPNIQMFSSRVSAQRKDILKMFESLGFKGWYDYMSMLDYEPVELKTPHKLSVRNIEAEDFEMVFNHMGLCFVWMRETVDIKPFNVVDKLWASEDKKQASFDEWIKEKENTFVYFDQREFIGSGLILENGDIDDVFVVIKHQGKGYGKAIIIDLIERVKARGQSPMIGYVGVNERAGRLYHDCGFILTQHAHYIRMFTKR